MCRVPHQHQIVVKECGSRHNSAAVDDLCNSILRFIYQMFYSLNHLTITSELTLLSFLEVLRSVAFSESGRNAGANMQARAC